MELELMNKDLNCWELLLNTSITREETLEMIVPDACPDIGTMLDTDGRLCLRQREVTTGCAAFGGTVYCSILYLPDGAEGVCCLQAELPVQCSADAPDITPESRVLSAGRVLSADTRAVNPRKVLVRVNVAVDVEIYVPKAQKLCCGVASPADWGIQQRVEQRECSLISAVTEKQFSFSEDLTLPGSKPELAEVLRLRGTPFCSETKLSEGKLIVKGGVSAELLYRSAEGQLVQAGFEVPFAQVVPVESGGGETACQTAFVLTDWQLVPPERGDRVLSLELELSVQAVLWEKRQLEVLTDAYSINYPAVPEFQPCVLPKLIECSSRRLTGHEVMETMSAVATVLDARAYLVQTQITPENGSWNVTGIWQVNAVYSGEDGVLNSAGRQITLNCSVQAPEQARCRGAFGLSELDVMASGGGIEVRLTAECRVTLVQEQQSCGLCAFAVEEEKRLDNSGQPSIVLRQLEAGESLWEIAKTYLTTCGEIRQANDLAGDTSALPGQLLLIPRKR